MKTDCNFCHGPITEGEDFTVITARPSALLLCSRCKQSFTVAFAYLVDLEERELIELPPATTLIC